MKIVTADQMRRIEQECARSGIPSSALMENAGKAVASVVMQVIGQSRKNILVLVGPGNNGGDGLVAGRYLHDSGHKICFYLLRSRMPDDRNLALVRERGIEIIECREDEGFKYLESCLSTADVIIDAVFGTGKGRKIEGEFAVVLSRVAEIKKSRTYIHVFAVDLPSGLDADTGTVDPSCPNADYTITLGFPKRGLFNMPGAGKAGKIKVVDIGIPPNIAADVSPEMITGSWVKSVLPLRPIIANKGTFGKVMVVAGSPNYTGAPFLACMGAMRVGAGLVTLAIPERLQPILATKLTEVTYLPLPDSGNGFPGKDSAQVLREMLDGYDVLLVGCGLGRSKETAEQVESLVLSGGTPEIPIVIDADGLNILAEVIHREKSWRRLPADAILTPHPGEMARLTGMSVESIQSDRLGVAARMARDWHKTVVLKGAYTVVAAPGGRVMVSPFANPGLASAGTGDVLAGMIAGLVAQGLPLFEASVAGVYLHGKAGEMVCRRIGDTGMIAGDLLPVLPEVIKQLRENHIEIDGR